MTLYAFPMDRTGCGMYRIVWPLEAVERALGLDYRLIEAGSVEEKHNFRVGHDLKGGVDRVYLPDDCTGMLIQRPTSEMLIEALELIKSKTQIPLLVDVDDDLTVLSPKHPAFKHLHPRHRERMPGHSATSVKRACALADVVIASTPALLERYAKPGQGVLLRNRLPSHLVPSAVGDSRPSLKSGELGLCGDHPHTAPRVSAPHKDVSTADLVVGWPGSLDTHPEDLRPLNRALNRLRPHFVIVGPKPASAVPPHHAVFTGRVDFDDWIPAIREAMDIGVAPLEDSAFNVAKSWLKPLELSAAGLPFVASRTPEYAALNAGLLAESPKEFQAHLTRLLSDPDLRASEAARNAAIAEQCTYDRYVDEWASILRPWVGSPAQLTQTKEITA